MAREITFINFEISLVVFMPNITTNHAITYTNQHSITLLGIHMRHIQHTKEKHLLSLTPTSKSLTPS